MAGLRGYAELIYLAGMGKSPFTVMSQLVDKLPPKMPFNFFNYNIKIVGTQVVHIYFSASIFTNIYTTVQNFWGRYFSLSNTIYSARTH